VGVASAENWFISTEKTESSQEAYPAWENISLGFIEDVHQW